MLLCFIHVWWQHTGITSSGITGPSTRQQSKWQSHRAKWEICEHVHVAVFIKRFLFTEDTCLKRLYQSCLLFLYGFLSLKIRHSPDFPTAALRGSPLPVALNLVDKTILGLFNPVRHQTDCLESALLIKIGGWIAAYVGEISTGNPGAF